MRGLMQPAFVGIYWLKSRKKKVHENAIVVLRTCQKVLRRRVDVAKRVVVH
jgi:hypothetical protein